ncbi:MAG: long-chain fatty acid--CoA ligase, partial [Lapillicoccus sp.]
MSFNLATILRESAKATPDRDVLRFVGGAMTYAQLDAASTRCAAGLKARGLAPGAAVAVQVPNLPEFVIAWFGILKAGMTMVPLNPLLKGSEIAYHLQDSASLLLITFVGFLEEAVRGASEVPLVVVPMPGIPLPEGFSPFATLMATEPDLDDEIAPTNADDTACIIYTSGTTGRPKGAELTHFGLFMGASVGGQNFGASEEDVALAVLPFFHVFGLAAVLNTNICFGGTLSVVPRFDVAAVLDAVERDRVSVVLGVPTMLQALLAQDTAGRDLSSLRVAISGGASLPGDVMRAFEEKFGIVVLEGFGMSETGAICTFNSSVEDRRVLSIGKPQWGVEVRVVDLDDATLPRGSDHIGELVVRGHVVMKGYLGRPEETAEAFRGGWFHTGDLGYQDEDDFIFIVDRSKDLVIRGGYNVYPREVEEVLYGHPAIAEAAVIGKPDARLGEEVVAVVALKPGAQVTADEIIAFCRDQMAA